MALVFCLSAEVFGKENGQDPTQAELISEVQTIQPGKSFWAAVRLTMKEGWHTYWKNPGDSGLPASVTWELPQGLQSGELLWPLPERIESGLIVNFGYENEVLLLTEIKADVELREGEEVTLKARVRWLVCRDVCLPFEKDISRTLPVGIQQTGVDPAWSAHFAKIRRLLPRAEPNWKFDAVTQGRQIRLNIIPDAEAESAPIEGMAFFPEEHGMIDYTAGQQFDTINQGYLLTLIRAPIAVKPYLKGILVISRSGRKTSILLPEIIVQE